MVISVDLIQQIITMTVATLLTIFIIALWLKKSTFNFGDLAYVMTYGGSDAAARYYGKPPKIDLKNEYSAYDCEYTTKAIMIDCIKDEAVLDRIRAVMVLKEINPSSSTAALVGRGVNTGLKEQTDEYKFMHEILSAKVDILKMKRVDLGVSDRDIKVKYKVCISLINDEYNRYEVIMKFTMRYSADWFAFVDDMVLIGGNK